MINDQITLMMQAYAARLKVIEGDNALMQVALDALKPDWRTPKGASGTMTPVEDAPQVIGYVTPKDDYANVRIDPRVDATLSYKLTKGQTIAVHAMTNTTFPGTFKWYMLEDDNYVREDVVTFTPDKPAPATPIHAALWPSPISSYTTTNTHHNHRQHVGIDLAARIGTPIFSGPNEGYVTKAFHCIPCGDDPEKQAHMGTGEAGYGYGLGNYVVARYYQHPAENKGHFLYVLYAHLSRISVQEKTALPPYTVIGEVGTSGNSSGPHLHIETRYSDNPLADFYSIRANEIDPSSIFKVQS